MGSSPGSTRKMSLSHSGHQLLSPRLRFNTKENSFTHGWTIPSALKHTRASHDSLQSHLPHILSLLSGSTRATISFSRPITSFQHRKKAPPCSFFLLPLFSSVLLCVSLSLARLGLHACPIYCPSGSDSIPPIRPDQLLAEHTLPSSL